MENAKQEAVAKVKKYTVKKVFEDFYYNSGGYLDISFQKLQELIKEAEIRLQTPNTKH